MRQFEKSLLSVVATLAALAVLCPIAFGQAPLQPPQPQTNFLCAGEYALCAAATCTPTGGQILVNTKNGKVPFPAATCTCPILKGVYVVDVNGGNMQGSCQPTSVSSIWSGYFPKGMQPQAITDWQTADSPAQLCGAKEMQGTELANCFSFNCSRAGKINGTDVATCTCALGEDFEGNPVPADTAFFTQAGQCNQDGTDYCKNHPIALPLGGIDDLSANKTCFDFPSGSGRSANLFGNDPSADLLGGRAAADKKTSGK